MNQYAKTDGFTIIETIVTIFVVAVFTAILFQSFMVLESQRTIVARNAKASDIAYSNLRKVTNRPSGLTHADCTAYMDLTSGTPPGLDLWSKGYNPEPASVIQTLGDGSSQSLRAYAPYGCTDFTSISKPIKIVSTITYDGGESAHAIFVD